MTGSLLTTLFATTVAACCFFTIGCGSGDDNSDLRNANEVRTEQTSATATVATKDALKLGETADFDGVKVRVVSAERKTPTDLAGRKPTAPQESWLIVHIEAENTTNATASQPGLSVVCADGSRGPSYANDATDAIKSGELPAKSRQAGTLLFGVPANCFPATLLASPVLQIGGKPAAQSWRLQ